MPMERPGAVRLRGKPFTLVGPELKVGQTAPDFTVVGKNLKPVTLHDTLGRFRIFSVVPSLDTPVCDAQTRRFNREATELPEAKIYTISVDLPFALSRWTAAAGVDHVVMLSDHRECSFGINYGCLIKELRLLCRAIFVLDESNTIRYAEYVKEIAAQPDFEAAIEALRKLHLVAG
jgi:thioredoxin-dependent peroxiredoxin